MIQVSEKVLKRRVAVERWKANNRERYLQQKRDLSSRPSYRAKMRAKYHAERQELKNAGILPRKVGRPRLYPPEEWREVERERGRLASARYRNRKKLSLVSKNNESTTTSPASSSESDRSSYTIERTSKITQKRHWVGHPNEWEVSDPLR